MAALADDSGLSVAALDGRPGVYTADWAERQWFEGAPGRDWYMAMGKVEGMLAEKGPDTDRSAAFHCVLAIAWPDGENAVYEGRCDGSLTWPPRGLLGFGYDPVFQPDGFQPIRTRLGVAYADDCIEFGATWRRDFIDAGERPLLR